MQAAKTYLHGAVRLSEAHRGKRRSTPVWELRYRLPSGKDSRKVLGRAWLKSSRPAVGFMTRTQAESAAQTFLDRHADDSPAARRTFGLACDDFLRRCERERGLRRSTLHDYSRIAKTLRARAWRADLTWESRPLDTLTEADLLTLRSEMIDSGKSADTLNHYRRIIRGAFGTETHSPALAWRFLAVKPEAEGKLRFYTPTQVAALKTATPSELDRAVYTLAVEAGPRQSEIRALQVRSVDFEAGRIRLESGYTTRGGHAGTKGRRARSVPMSDNVRAALAPYCEGKPESALVFEHPEQPGEPLCGMMLYRHFKADLKRAGLPEIRFHDLRHSFGTQAAKRFPIHEVQAMMGHANIATTMRYLHYVEDPRASATLSALWASEAPSAPVVDISRHRAA
jgi:integrase